MVLSRKKLKQKLRTLLAEPGSAAEAETEVQAILERLGSSHRRPKSRSRRRKETPEAENETGGAEELDKAAELQNEERKPEKQKIRAKGDFAAIVAEEKRQKVKEKQNNVEAIAASESNAQTVDATSEERARKVYVGGIPYYSTEDDIRSFFDECGTITQVDCILFPDTRKFRGIAILRFKTEAAAKRALAMDGADMGGFYLKIQPYRACRAEKTDFAPQIVEGYNRIYVGNLSWDVTEDDLRTLFSDCRVSAIRFGVDKSTGNFKGYAHVDLMDSTSLAVALKLDQTVVRERPARIRCAVPKKDESKKSEPNGRILDADSPKLQHQTISQSDTHSKKRRRCYVCGVPGHLSSSCPSKLAETTETDYEAETMENADFVTDNVAGSNVKAVMPPSKKRRRTCYQCGVPGHLSSSCPNKLAAEKRETEIAKNSIVVDNAVDAGEKVKAPQKKKRRRTCYECGVPGHLSSDCPSRKGKFLSNNG